MLDVHDLASALHNDAALDGFVAAWRAGRLPKASWTHAAHVAVCAYHAWPDVAPEPLTDAMRRGIRAFNEAVGTPNTATSGYHETLTRFWCGVVADRLADTRPPTRLEGVRDAVAAFGEARALHREYYDFDVVRDAVARASWVPPTRRQTETSRSSF
ncbi:MAG: hypothetical protein AB7O28_26060 [Vicinamibacterales bacterium]